MKASDLDRVTELLSNHQRAAELLDRFRGIPDTATEIEITIRWPNPDPDAPGFARRLNFNTSIPRDSEEGRTIKEDVDARLLAERERLAGELTDLGVEPDA